MPLGPVPLERVQIAKDFGLRHAEDAAIACRLVGLPYWAACANQQKEAGSEYNPWGGADASPFVQLHDEHVPLNRNTFRVYEIAVQDAGVVPTGVGPGQITWAGKLQKRADGTFFRDGGFLREAREQDKRLWVPVENLEFSFKKLWGYYRAYGRSWVNAGRLYNGSLDYGIHFEQLCKEWHERFDLRGDIHV